jgi:two-component system cell cycle response regulator
MSSKPLRQRVIAACRLYVDRLTWPGRDAPGSAFDDPATMARTFTYLFGVGATLLLLSLTLPHSPDRNTVGLLAVAAAAYLSSAGFLALYDRLPAWGFQVAPAAGTLLISFAIYFAGPDAADAYVMYYFWAAMSACYFLRPSVAAIHLALASAAYGLVLLVAPEDIPLPALKWTLLTGTLLVVGSLMTALREQVGRLVRQLANAARTDSLTGLANRRELDARFAAELERSSLMGRPLSFLALDADWFKEFNDRFGHTAGQRALIMLASALRTGARPSDVVARLGGEDFAVLAPETDQREAFLLAERLRAEVKSAFAREPEHLTVSCGVASFPAHGLSSGELIHASDRALSEAKERGRNRSVVFSHAHEPGADGWMRGIELTSQSLASLVSLAEAVDRRKGSPANSHRVSRYADRLARALNLPEEDVERVRVAALVRDVGEVVVPESVLGKAGPLTNDERSELERHPEIGAGIVGAAQLGRMDEWIRAHHERPDGGGYPRGLRDHQIPLEGKIIAVADAYAAMTATRPYREAFSPRRAMAELQARAGGQFDHDVVEAFLSLSSDPEVGPELAEEAPAPAARR